MMFAKLRLEVCELLINQIKLITTTTTIIIIIRKHRNTFIVKTFNVN